MDEVVGIRIGDEEREAYSQILRTAYAEGRITGSELEERLEEVLNSKTEDELLPVVADLPVDPPSLSKPQTDPKTKVSPPSQIRPWVGRLLAAYSPAIICTAIWAMTGGFYFWPMWVFFGLSIPVLGAIVAVLSDDGEDDEFDEEDNAADG